MWNRFLKDFLSFSSADRNGIIVLSVLIISALLAAILVPSFMDRKRMSSEIDFEALLSTFYSEKSEQPELIESPLPVIKPFRFDPNRIGREEMQKLGFNEQLASTYANYLASGGRFFKKEDVKKIYGMTDDFYNSLEPYMDILSERERPSAEIVMSPQTELIMIELNSADSSELRKLHGIGPVFSSRIIRYRELLGGFHSTDQLMEVYGISPELYQRVSAQLQVDTSCIRLIDVNNATFSELLRHPYISREQVQRIFAYIQHEGCFLSEGDLFRSGIFDSLSLQKLRPYLLFHSSEADQ
jgi:competence protein ComEA